MDGGLKRLVRILHDFCICPPPPANPALIYSLSPPNACPPRPVPTLNPHSFDKHAAYRFSLAFQCVVNIGVRGSEPIRSRVVQAGTLDVVGCIVEAWLANKGFAVGPSSSAIGMPREIREQRLARRQARRNREATELARVLERQIQVESFIRLECAATGVDVYVRPTPTFSFFSCANGQSHRMNPWTYPLRQVLTPSCLPLPLPTLRCVILHLRNQTPPPPPTLPPQLHPWAPTRPLGLSSSPAAYKPTQPSPVHAVLDSFTADGSFSRAVETAHSTVPPLRSHSHRLPTYAGAPCKCFKTFVVPDLALTFITFWRQLHLQAFHTMYSIVYIQGLSIIIRILSNLPLLLPINLLFPLPFFLICFFGSYCTFCLILLFLILIDLLANTKTR
jgi:hypothetical protein